MPTIYWDADSQSFACLCLAEGNEILRTSKDAQVLGRRMRWAPNLLWNPNDPDFVSVTALLPIFNPGNLPNRSEEAFPFVTTEGTFDVHLFVDDGVPWAKHWNFADALRYLAFFHVLRPGLGVSVTEFMADTVTLVGMEPSPDAPDPFVRRLSARAEDVAVASMSVEEAIHLLTDAAGLHYELALGGAIERTVGQGALPRDKYALRVMAALEKPEEADITPQRQSVAAQVYDIAREAPFTDTAGRTERAVALANRAQQANLTVDRRAVNAPIILGGYKHYEVTLLLRPGWLPKAEYQLDNLSTDQEIADAGRFWQLQFSPEFEQGEKRIPRSVYHAAHPQHWPVSTVARYWIFPDDLFWMNTDGTSDYARDG